MNSKEEKNQKKNREIEFEIFFPEEKGNSQKIYSLQEWLKDEKILGLKIERSKGKTFKNSMGHEYLDVLNIILSSTVLIAFANGFFSWLKARNRKLKITIKTKKKLLTIDSENIKNQEDIVKIILSHIRDKKEE